MKNILKGGALLVALCFVFALGRRRMTFIFAQSGRTAARAAWLRFPREQRARHWAADTLGWLGNSCFWRFWCRQPTNRGIGTTTRRPCGHCSHRLWTAATIANIRIWIVPSARNPVLVLGISPLSFNVTDISEGRGSSAESTSRCQRADGHDIHGFYEDANGNLTSVTPWSSSLIVTPEPSSLFMVGGAVLLGCFCWWRRRRSREKQLTFSYRRNSDGVAARFGSLVVWQWISAYRSF
jgi:hypothetical protein